MKKEFNIILGKLQAINKDHPTYTFSTILSLAFIEYANLWGLSNKEVIECLEKFSSELELDSDKIASPEYMDKLLKDVNNFDHILDAEEDE